MLDRKLVAAALQSRDAYACVSTSEVPETLDEVLAPVWKAVAAYYERDGAAVAVDVDVLCGSLTGRNPKKLAATVALIKELANEAVSSENVRHMIFAQQRAQRGMVLASAIAGDRSQEEIEDALAAYESLLRGNGDENEDEGPAWAGVLSSRIDQSKRILLSPRILNQYINGGVLPGHNITIFGRPESGKTALAITMACGFARRGKRVLYIGNEDPIQDLMVRAITNLTNATADEVAQDPERYERAALEAGAARMVFRATAPGTVRELGVLIKRHKPDILIIDQLRNIQSGKSENFTQLLDKNAQTIRALGKRYSLVTVSVTQAGDSASGRPVLDMGDVDSSNTGIPGAADLMIGVGVTEALERQGQRMLSLCKNKLGGAHHAQVVTLDTFRSKIK